jgi:hypothetical protein
MKKQLADLLSRVRAVSCFCGFDGFVDEVVHTVDRRFDAEHYSRIPTLTEYGRRIADGSGLSINIEIVTVDKKLGGNGPIFANALKRFGAGITYIGSVGKDAIDPVFSQLADGSTVIGIADPGRTDAMEFSDGKIIRSKLFALNDVSWDSVQKRVGLDAFVGYMDSADLISFNNWTMLPHMTALWDGILTDAIPMMKTLDKREKVLFFDLADPEKRTQADLLEALDKIKVFHECGFHTILGLNKKEACEIAEALGNSIQSYRDHPLEALADFLYGALSVDCLVIHPVDCAACVVDNIYFTINGPYCANPKLTTGAGDNFNAGFVYGYLQNLTPKQCLLLGTATSGYYVRACHSPNLEEVRRLLTQWEAGALD